VLASLKTLAWIACVVYSTIPAFWLLIHPRAEYWRRRRASPYKILLPVWIAMWAINAAITAPWRRLLLYQSRWTWIPAITLLFSGLLFYRRSRQQFTLAQFAGLSEIQVGSSPQRLATTGIRAHIRHPVYLGHLCGMLAWSLGTGLAVCWALTAFAVITGAVMIRMEDQELERRFGEPYRVYRSAVPAFIPNVSQKR
jgi:protein-S-isoprenylcysteine O-methyltransferase Ste14